MVRIRFENLAETEWFSEIDPKVIERQIAAQIHIEPCRLQIDCPYAMFIEYGTEPAGSGKGTPPYREAESKIIDWCERKLGLDRRVNDEWHQIKRIIGSVLGQGRPPRPFIRPAIYESLEIWKSERLFEADHPMDRLGQLIISNIQENIVRGGIFDTMALVNSISWVSGVSTSPLSGQAVETDNELSLRGPDLMDRIAVNSLGKGTGLVVVYEGEDLSGDFDTLLALDRTHLSNRPKFTERNEKYEPRSGDSRKRDFRGETERQNPRIRKEMAMDRTREFTGGAQASKLRVRKPKDPRNSYHKNR